MDKFVIRQPKSSINSKNGETRTTCLKQTKIQQLAGVVVYEELQFIRDKLLNSETSPDDKVSFLAKLEEKKPSKEILQSTGIGKVVHRLCRHEEQEISSAATKLYDKWKAHILRIIRRKPIEVDSDLQTKNGRANGVRIINSGLNDEELAKSVESEIFRKCKNVLGCDYTRLTRKAHFAFKNDEALRERAINGVFDVSAFVRDLRNNLIKVYHKK